MPHFTLYYMVASGHLSRIVVRRKKITCLEINGRLGKMPYLSTVNLDSESTAPYLLAILSWSSLSVSTPRSFKHTPQLIKGDGEAFDPAPTTQGILLQHFWPAIVPRVVTLVLRKLLFRLWAQHLFSNTAGQIWGIWRSRHWSCLSFRFKQFVFLRLEEPATTAPGTTLIFLVIAGFPFLPQEVQGALLHWKHRWCQVVLQYQKSFHQRYACE